MTTFSTATSTVREEVERRAHLTEPYFPEHSAGDYRGQVGPRPCPTYAAEVRWERHWTIWARGRQDRHEAASL